MCKRDLTVDLLREEAGAFAETESDHREQSLFGVTDGKAVGTYQLGKGHGLSRA